MSPRSSTPSGQLALVRRPTVSSPRVRLAALALSVTIGGFGCASEDACPALATSCPTRCPSVVIREVDTDKKCQFVPAEHPCSAIDVRPAITGCCAGADGKIYAVVGFPSCNLQGFRPCTAEETRLEQSSATAACK